MIRTAIIITARIMRCFAPVVFATPLFDVVQEGAT